MGTSLRGEKKYSYFVRWDMCRPGGRYFETNVSPVAATGQAIVNTCDGDKKTCSFSEIYHLGIPVKAGDPCIAYYKGGLTQCFAFAGYVVAVDVNGNQADVQFADGDRDWCCLDFVHKMVSYNRER